MRIERIIYSVLIIVASALAAINWRKASLFALENEELRLQVDSLQSEAANAERIAELAKENSDKLREQRAELMRLRNQVTQMGGEKNAADNLKVENDRLRTQLQQTRAAEVGDLANSISPQRDEKIGRDVFPRESWAFAGYATPESALVSAIWAMKEGNPETYLKSLAPEEQQRMAAVWENKSETEIAEKHKGDVSTISGLRVLERRNTSPTEVVMTVLIEGPGRPEKIRMSQVGNEWKFGGFIREQQQAQP
ncbi:MAG TPA: hypothetical protein VF773_01065 [Verrucomicrobiae bacterium]